MVKLEITIQELKEILLSYNISTELSDSQLKKIIDNITNELMSLINIPIGPVTKKYINFEFKGNKLFLPMYPIYSINYIKINETIIDEYNIKKDDGYIKFNNDLNGYIEVDYNYGLELTPTIKSLILDMIIVRIKYNIEGNVTNVKEGDISVSYDNTSGLQSSIQKRIDNLRNDYAARLRVV